MLMEGAVEVALRPEVGYLGGGVDGVVSGSMVAVDEKKGMIAILFYFFCFEYGAEM